MAASPQQMRRVQTRLTQPGVVRRLQVDPRCSGSQGVRIPSGDSGGAQARWRPLEAATTEAWRFGVLCGEALDVRQQLAHAALVSMLAREPVHAL